MKTTEQRSLSNPHPVGDSLEGSPQALLTWSPMAPNSVRKKKKKGKLGFCASLLASSSRMPQGKDLFQNSVFQELVILHQVRKFVQSQVFGHVDASEHD